MSMVTNLFDRVFALNSCEQNCSEYRLIDEEAYVNANPSVWLSHGKSEALARDVRLSSIMVHPPETRDGR